MEDEQSNNEPKVPLFAKVFVALLILLFLSPILIVLFLALGWRIGFSSFN